MIAAAAAATVCVAFVFMPYKFTKLIRLIFEQTWMPIEQTAPNFGQIHLHFSIHYTIPCVHTRAHDSIILFAFARMRQVLLLPYKCLSISCAISPSTNSRLSLGLITLRPRPLLSHSNAPLVVFQPENSKVIII